ncbi:MAG: TIR domain-containing protein, partial [Gammaproteobacteria bacterium]|nr:TIR domain-containing protein [Gammaproteobacteria bacterium]
YKPFAAYQGDDPYIFVSYAHEDAERVYPELEWLRGQGFNVWYDEGISPGAVWREGLARAIKDSSLFLFYVTANSVTSPHCLRELNFGQEEERPFLAVHLEATRLPDALRLSISDRQAILAHELSRADFEEKLRQTLSSVVPVGSPPTASRATSWDPARVRRHSILGYALIALSILVVGVLFLAWPRTLPPLDPQVEGDTSAEASVVKSIAVLAFDNMSDDPQMNYLGDGIAEELMNALYQAGLRVASRTDAFSFKGANVRTKEIGDELGVETVLEGSVRRSGDQLRITAQLINVADGFHLWSDVYERPMGDLFDIQDAIVGDVSRELLGTLGVSVVPSASDLAGTRNIRAYEVFMLGRYEYGFDTPEAIERAIGYYEEAIRLDPDFHQPYASLARAYSRRAVFTGERTEALTKIAQIRVEFERREEEWYGHPEWWRSLLEISTVTWDPDGIERALATGIRAKRTDPTAQDPLDVDPYDGYTLLLTQSRLYQDAIKYADVAGGSWIMAAQSHFVRGELNLAFDAMRRVRRFSPTVGPFIHGRLLAIAGRVDEARELLNAPGLTSPYRDYLRWQIAFSEGDVEGALAILESLEAADVSPTVLGLCRLQMGDINAGFHHLERAVEQHDEILLYLGNALEAVLPEHILNDPRYLEVLEATGFTEAWAKELCRRAAALTPVTGIEMSCLADL